MFWINVRQKCGDVYVKISGYVRNSSLLHTRLCFFYSSCLPQQNITLPSSFYFTAWLGTCDTAQIHTKSMLAREFISTSVGGVCKCVWLYSGALGAFTPPTLSIQVNVTCFFTWRCTLKDSQLNSRLLHFGLKTINMHYTYNFKQTHNAYNLKIHTTTKK